MPGSPEASGLEVPKDPNSLDASGFVFFCFYKYFQQMHQLYILFSKSTAKFYVGETHNIDDRIVKHNQHSYSGSFTKIANDWELVFLRNCENKEEAVFLEKFIKKMKSKVFIQKIILNPEILDDIILKNKI